MKKIVLLGCLFIATSFVAGCSNTLDGAGRDISNMGDGISDTF